MRLLIVHQYFKTPEEGSGIRTWHLARAFQHAGHEVKIISGHNELEGEKTVNGLNLHYFKISYSNHQGVFRRIWAFFRFVRASQKYLKTYHDFDLLYILSTPLTTGLIGLHAKRKYGLRYLFEVGDLWPLAPIQMGVIKPAWIQKRLYQFEERIYTNAERLAALSPAIQQAMEYTVDYRQPVAVIPNMADCSFFRPNTNIPERFTADNPLVIGYQGAIGKANHLEYLLLLAEALHKENLPVSIRIMGGGSEKQRLKKLSASQSIVSWTEEGGKEHVREELATCHISYISYASYPVLETGCPNKLFDGLAAGKVILLNFGGWSSRLVTENECGFSYKSENPEEAVSLIKKLIQNPILIEAYQQNARKLAVSAYDMKIVTQKALDLIDELTVS